MIVASVLEYENIAHLGKLLGRLAGRKTQELISKQGQ